MHFPTSFFKPINFSGTFFSPVRSIIYDGIAFHNLRRGGAIVLVLFIKLNPILHILKNIIIEFKNCIPRYKLIKFY